MIELKTVPIPDGALSSDTARKLQENVAEAFRQITSADDLSIVTVNGGRYKTVGTERYILVDSRGGPVTIILQLPINKQQLTVIREYSAANPVTIVRIDGKSLGNDGTAVNAAFDKSVNLISDASQWWVSK